MCKAFRKMLVLLVILAALDVSYAATGVIWSDSDKDFISLFKIAEFAAVRNDFLQRSRDLEFHNFKKEILKVVYFQEDNLVSYINNDTEISGVYGELWNLLSDYLNFTLIPIKLENAIFGSVLKNGSYNGLLGSIHRNQSQIIPRSGMIKSNLMLLEYTIPLWTIRYHFYIIPEWIFNEAWMLRLFSVELWYSCLVLLLALSVVGYICEKNSKKELYDNIHYNLRDHIFYTIAIASSQGSVPCSFNDKSRIIYICTSIFSWVILIAFSSHAIFHVTNKKVILPFNGFKSLFEESKYSIIAFHGTNIYEQFQNSISIYEGTVHKSRVLYVPSVRELYKRVCFSEERKFAVFEPEDRYMANGKNFCHLVHTRGSYFETWIASAVKRGFRYKRSFDIGILKLLETGLADGLRKRWMGWKVDEIKEVPFQSISMRQVYLIYGVLFSGIIMSLSILIFEHIVSLGTIKERLKILKSYFTKK